MRSTGGHAHGETGQLEHIQGEITQSRFVEQTPKGLEPFELGMVLGRLAFRLRTGEGLRLFPQGFLGTGFLLPHCVERRGLRHHDPPSQEGRGTAHGAVLPCRWVQADGLWAMRRGPAATPRRPAGPRAPRAPRPPPPARASPSAHAGVPAATRRARIPSSSAASASGGTASRRRVSACWRDVVHRSCQTRAAVSACWVIACVARVVQAARARGRECTMAPKVWGW